MPSNRSLLTHTKRWFGLTAVLEHNRRTGNFQRVLSFPSRHDLGPIRPSVLGTT